MTREEAIRWLSGIANDFNTSDAEADALNMAIKALEQEPCNLPQLGATCDKTISNQIKPEPITPIRDYMVHCEEGDELDEAIRRCDEIVRDITWFCNSPSKYIEQRRHESAVKLNQLASWLRELKRLRAQEPCEDAVSLSAIEWHDMLVADGNGQYHNERVAYKSQIDDLPPVTPKLAKCEDAVSRESVTDVIRHSDIFSTQIKRLFDGGVTI